MSALTWKVTAAGRAALVNAQNTGTLPLRVAHVGITEQAFTADVDGLDLVLPGELKRLTTFAGDAVAADTIHVSITDDSTDSYTLRGFALYFDTGVLFGIYGQSEPILEKSSQAMMLLAFDAIFADIDATSLSFGNTDFALPPATTERTGIVELATAPEAVAGTDSARAMTPAADKAALDDRLGIGAPSGFVKGLLTQATAALFRTALAIKGAALKDEGAGKGLDADLLDGQHGAYYLDYEKFNNVPVAFPPAAHSHSATDITSGMLSVQRGGTGVATFAAGSYLVGNDTGAVVVKTPAQVLAGIGAAAAAHSHAISEVNGLQDALDLRPLQTTVTTQINTAVNALINGSPGALDTLNELAAAMGDDPNFAATVANALANKVTAVLGYQSDANNLPGSGFYRLDNVAANTPRGDWATILNVAPFGTGSRSVQLAFSWNFSDSFAIRHLGGAWRDLWHSGNFNPATKADKLNPKFDGSGLGVYPDGTGGSSGFQVSWNVAGIEFGETSFINNRGGGGGGYAWFNRASPASGLGAPLMTLGSSGNLSIAGGLSCVTFNASGSDIRLKTDVKPFAPRPLHRLLAALPNAYGAVTSYVHRADHTHRLGPIAQDMERVEPAYMGTIDVAEGQIEGVSEGTYKTVDKASAAYEQAMWAGQEIDRLLARIEALESR